MEKKRNRVLRVLHASDIHLGEDGQTNARELDGRAEWALKALVDLSIQARTNLLIIAGDLFDNNRVDATIVDFALRELARAPAPVVILPGNHDCLISDSVYRRTCFSNPTPNICVLTAPGGDTLSFPELDVAVWGKPINSYGGDQRPMMGIPPPGKERWQIAVAHGYYVGTASDEVWSLQISEEEVVRSCRDYVALGHWGTFRCVCDGPVKAYYSGSASSLTSSVAIVDFSDGAGIQVSCCRLPL